ncbi:MAG TPA: hypothetical protein VK553_09150 [Candidatus Nitrosopolaris rasttigaisensis]|nr:hypothetical protein [Candidatus Nitrosopolaris rasttigaisensis]
MENNDDQLSPIELKEGRNSIYELNPLVLNLQVTEVTIRNRIQE